MGYMGPQKGVWGYMGVTQGLHRGFVGVLGGSYRGYIGIYNP